MASYIEVTSPGNLAGELGLLYTLIAFACAGAFDKLPNLPRFELPFFAISILLGPI